MSKPARSKSQEISEDRRRQERIGLKVPVDYSSVDAFFTEFTSNINEGGMFIEMEQLPEIGADIQLQFRLPGVKQPLQVEARVAWVSDGKADAPVGAGVEFKNLTAEAREQINRIVRDLRA